MPPKTKKAASAVIECSEAARECGVPIVADGGIRTSGDLTKALAAGAQSVMIGSLFAGTRESPGRIVQRQGRRYKVTRGRKANHTMSNCSEEQVAGAFPGIAWLPPGRVAPVHHLVGCATCDGGGGRDGATIFADRAAHRQRRD